MNTLEVFFTGKFFKIPNYQRDYAWIIDNIDDLFEDIIESIETNTAHYIGTFILSQKSTNEVFNIVDGQQRLTTLTMIISAAIKELKSETDKIIFRDKFINSNNKNKLELLNENNLFFQNLLAGNKEIPTNKSQELLINAYKHIEERIINLKNSNLTPESFVEALKKLEVMEFIEKNDGKAIRIFQTVNDRGKPLSNMEKAKSLLIYYSNRFLNAKLDDDINQKFGEIFKYFIQIKDIAKRNSINPISQKNFTEDFIMRYHFLSFENEYYDYNFTIDEVLDIFLKHSLKNLKNNLDVLQTFIEKYVNDLHNFFKSFFDLLNKVKDKKYYKIFSVLGLSALIYPLAVRLEMRKLIDTNITTIPDYKFIDLLEITDIRVYKTRGTDPARDISFLAKDAANFSSLQIENKLITIIKNFMNNSEFKNRLSGNVYGNRALKHIFIEYDEKLLKENQKTEYTTEDVIILNSTEPTIDHIFPQERPFDFPNRGFNSEQDYLNQLHRFGNLMIIEKSLNSKCQNAIPDRKIIDNSLYQSSKFVVVSNFTSIHKNNSNSFNSADIDTRTIELVEFCLDKWKI